MEAIAHKSQNIKRETTVDKKRVGHKLIRRVSMDQFYALVTGEEDAFYKMCMILPKVIGELIGDITVPHDTVVDELKEYANNLCVQPEEFAMAMAVYMLGFRCYTGFY